MFCFIHPREIVADALPVETEAGCVLKHGATAHLAQHPFLLVRGPDLRQIRRAALLAAPVAVRALVEFPAVRSNAPAARKTATVPRRASLAKKVAAETTNPQYHLATKHQQSSDQVHARQLRVAAVPAVKSRVPQRSARLRPARRTLTVGGRGFATAVEPARLLVHQTLRVPERHQTVLRLCSHSLGRQKGAQRVAVLAHPAHSHQPRAFVQGHSVLHFVDSPQRSDLLHRHAHGQRHKVRRSLVAKHLAQSCHVHQQIVPSACCAQRLPQFGFGSVQKESVSGVLQQGHESLESRSAVEALPLSVLRAVRQTGQPVQRHLRVLHAHRRSLQQLPVVRSASDAISVEKLLALQTQHRLPVSHPWLLAEQTTNFLLAHLRQFLLEPLEIVVVARQSASRAVHRVHDELAERLPAVVLLQHHSHGVVASIDQVDQTALQGEKQRLLASQSEQHADDALVVVARLRHVLGHDLPSCLQTRRYAARVESQKTAEHAALQKTLRLRVTVQTVGYLVDQTSQLAATGHALLHQHRHWVALHAHQRRGMEERRRHDQVRELVKTLRAEHAVEIALRVRQNSMLVQRQTKTVPVLRGGVHRSLQFGSELLGRHGSVSESLLRQHAAIPLGGMQRYVGMRRKQVWSYFRTLVCGAFNKKCSSLRCL